MQPINVAILFVKNGYTVGVKWPTESEIEWLSTPPEDEKTIVESALEDENNLVWKTVMVPNPSNYINLGLYFVGYLYSDILLESMGRDTPFTSKWTDELSDIFELLGDTKAS